MPLLPNFFLVGAPKAGTTAFLRYLEQHPAVFVSPIKEPSFFAPEILDADPSVRERYVRERPAIRRYLEQPRLERRSGFVLEWEEYLQLFKNAADRTAIGEGSVSYLRNPGSAAAIHARVPKARIMMMLRDPAERLRSAWASALVSGKALGFAEWLDRQRAAEESRPSPWGHISTGFYAESVARFIRTFSARQVRPFLYDDYFADAQAALEEAFCFLGVDAAWECDVSRQHNVTRVPRWPLLHTMTRPVRRAARVVLPAKVVARARERWSRPFRPEWTAQDRAKAIAIYQDDIQALAALLKRDLSAWLDPRAARSSTFNSNRPEGVP